MLSRGRLEPVKKKEHQPAQAAPRRSGRNAMTVSRRTFARIAAAGAATAVAAPAIAQQPTVKWRLASSFPKNLEGLWGASPTVAKFVNEMTDGKFEIQPFAAGEIVTCLRVVDAEGRWRRECC